VHARSNRSSWGRNALASAVQYAVVAEGWTSGCGAGCALGARRRIKDRLERVEPASDRRVATDRRDFTFRVEIWDDTGDSIGEHIAGVDDLEVAEATYRAAVARWPTARITLRQGARVVLESEQRR
jgi:hypothetical protein